MFSLVELNQNPGEWSETPGDWLYQQRMAPYPPVIYFFPPKVGAGAIFPSEEPPAPTAWVSFAKPGLRFRGEAPRRQTPRHRVQVGAIFGEAPPYSPDPWFPRLRTLRGLRQKPKPKRWQGRRELPATLFPDSTPFDWFPMANHAVKFRRFPRIAKGSQRRPSQPILGESFTLVVPILVQWDSLAPVRSRRHQQLVSQILNSLIMGGELIETDVHEWQLGFVAEDPQDWSLAKPETVAGAIDRLAAKVASLGILP